MVARHAKTAYAGGALVFPGGSVDEADHVLGADIAASYPHLSVEELALRVAAIRETFEESGVLLACDRKGGPVALADVTTLADARQGGNKPNFQAFLDRAGLRPDVDRLVPFARWITPPIRPKRFDTHFFVAVAPSGQSGAHDGAEVVDSIWIEPQVAVDEAAAGRAKLVFPTRMNLIRIGAAASVETAMAQASTTPVVPVMPEYLEERGETFIRIPAEAGYGGSLFPAIDPPSM